MKSVKAQIIDSLDWFLAKLKGTFTQKSEIVNNCVSTSTNVPLAAAQGKALSDSISALNSDLSQQISALNSNLSALNSDLSQQISALNSNLQIRNISILIPANNGDIYSSERNLYYDTIKITDKINWTCIIEASTDGTGNPTYVRYILSRTLLQLMDTVGEGSNVPRIRINSVGDVNILMSGETNQDYYVHVNITKL